MYNNLQFSLDKGSTFLVYFVIAFYYSKKSMTTKLSKLCYFTGWIPVVLTYQLFTNCTDGVPSSLSGRSSISLRMFANLTGSSCRKNAKEVLSHPLVEPTNKSKIKVLCKKYQGPATNRSVFPQTSGLYSFTITALLLDSSPKPEYMFVLTVVYVTVRRSVFLGGTLVHFPLRHGTYL